MLNVVPEGNEKILVKLDSRTSVLLPPAEIRNCI
jgi:hypothetical protein